MATIVENILFSAQCGSLMPTLCDPWARTAILAQRRSRVLEGDEVITLNDLEIRDTVSIPVAPLASFHHGGFSHTVIAPRLSPSARASIWTSLSTLSDFVYQSILKSIPPPPFFPPRFNKRLPQEATCSHIGRFQEPSLAQCG